MNILTLYFNRGNRYLKHMRVFANSVNQTMPNAKLEIVKIDAPTNKADHKYDTCHAFIKTVEHVLKMKKDYVVCDIDLMFVKSIESIYDYKFDLAVTTRETIPFNTGLWAIRYNERTEKFLQQWKQNTEVIRNILLKGEEEMEQYVHKHGGIDQASLAASVATNQEAVLKYLPCQEWNSCQHEWENVDENTKVIHIKSQLRKQCFGESRNDPPEYMKPLIKKWNKYYVCS